MVQYRPAIAQRSQLPDSQSTRKAIKVHRGRMMEKLGVHTVVGLVRLAEKASIKAHGK